MKMQMQMIGLDDHGSLWRVRGKTGTIVKNAPLQWRQASSAAWSWWSWMLCRERLRSSSRIDPARLVRKAADAGRPSSHARLANECIKQASRDTALIHTASQARKSMAPRSRTGCLTCRQRKLKCDEQKPVCGQCIKAQRECVPSSGITFRHQQNPSMNADDTDSLKSFYGYKETFAKSTTWVGVPKDLKFVHTSNPYEDEDGDGLALGLAHPCFENTQRHQDYGLDQSTYPAYATHGLEALSQVATQDQYGYAPQAAMTHHRSASQHSQSQVGASPQIQHTTPSQGLDFILNPTSNLSPAETGSNIDPRLHSHTPTAPASQHQSPIHVRTQSMTSVGGLASSRGKGTFSRGAIEDPELAYLLRDARNHALAWMDLYDSNSFFAARVPVLAVDCPLLLYSCACLSAKSLARVDGRRPIMDGQVAKSRQSKMEFWPGPPMDTESWMRKGRECYDIAVSLLRQSLAGASRPPTSSLPEDATAATLLAVQGAPLPTTDSDELVAATAILCVYEFLDASGPEWSRHLDGAKTLFDIAKDQAVPLTLPPSPVSIAQQVTQQLASQASPGFSVPHVKGLSPGRKAVFWNFARQDMLSAFINNTSTRLDTGDLSMWRSAGLKLTLDGYVCPSHPQCSGYVAEQAMGDDMIGNALVWLVMKLVNFIAAGDEVLENSSPLGVGARQRELLEHWESLEEQLRVWHEGLPDGFRPVAVRRSALECETEHWIPRPMCASTMQWYNFAKIQLLHNKPHLSTTTPLTGILGSSAPGIPGTSLVARHASYASILQQSRAHAKEIIAISNGRSDEGTRIHSVQPMWTAGLVLGNDQHPGENGEVSHEAETWRKAIVNLLRGLERDIGWASEYRVQSLLELWSLDPSWPADGFNEDMNT
ncbi:hypothetical protein AC578_7975 [Pseudocercospora eumusae]|uniref:Zn(2)-C6 fungal-type domain-containing protein n=2 Tax=Pseudocercospora eumusae TaxID=321146 RepID=A0A139HPK1_9PEZI|nr:hypothetical protein AC578_7975 [Pseudocercospora eumusae]